jgi:hypothetical protein
MSGGEKTKNPLMIQRVQRKKELSWDPLVFVSE